jgi:hypothetical protein
MFPTPAESEVPSGESDMKSTLALLGVVGFLITMGTTGCVVGPAYPTYPAAGVSVGVYGEYPYYSQGYYAYHGGYYNHWHHPYDRDHYFYRPYHSYYHY